MAKREYSEKVISAFLEHDKITDIMKATGLSRATIDRYRKDGELQKILTERKAMFIEAAVSQMQAGLTESVEVLRGIIKDKKVNLQARIYAISTLFTACRNWTEIADILRRIEKLEEAGEANFD